MSKIEEIMKFGVIFLQTVAGGGGGGGLGFKIVKFSFFGFSEKNAYFLGMKILWIYLGVITNLEYI